MAQSAPASGSVISARSRRLRTIGSVLVVAILAMAIYGVTNVMPTLRRSKESLGDFRRNPAPLTPEQETQRKALAAQFIFAYGYWSVCGALVLSAVFVAYLDFREVSRTYMAQRRAIWTEVAEKKSE